MNKIHVALKDSDYDILIGQDNLAEVGEVVDKKDFGDKAIIITDPVVNELYGNVVRASLRSAGIPVYTIEVPRGERFKTFDSATRLYNKLVEFEVHRDSCLLALSGGVIGDLAGFVAATYMRGINLIQVPTTLLAQVDAAIGGKTAVNHPKCKNLIGVFYQPKLVYIDVKTLTTLPERELKTGLAEVVKYGVIKDCDLFKFMEANVHHLNTQAFKDKETTKAALRVWQTIVTESAKIKTRVVESDEKEEGPRMILNFGHTIGHAIETLTKYYKYEHGEAVSIGMICAARIAQEMNLLDESSVVRIREILEKIGLPTKPEKIKAKAVIQALRIDKKVREGKIQFVLPRKIGEVEIRNDVPLSLVKRILKEAGCR